jgi:hypothetical protein
MEGGQDMAGACRKGRPQRNESRGERRPSFAFPFAREAKCIACVRLLFEVVFATQKHYARSKMSLSCIVGVSLILM